MSSRVKTTSTNGRAGAQRESAAQFTPPPRGERRGPRELVAGNAWDSACACGVFDWVARRGHEGGQGQTARPREPLTHVVSIQLPSDASGFHHVPSNRDHVRPVCVSDRCPFHGPQSDRVVALSLAPTRELPSLTDDVSTMLSSGGGVRLGRRPSSPTDIVSAPAIGGAASKAR